MCLYVCNASDPCINGCTDWGLVWVRTPGCPRNIVLDGGPDFSHGFDAALWLLVKLVVVLCSFDRSQVATDPSQLRLHTNIITDSVLFTNSFLLTRFWPLGYTGNVRNIKHFVTDLLTDFCSVDYKYNIVWLSLVFELLLCLEPIVEVVYSHLAPSQLGPKTSLTLALNLSSNPQSNPNPNSYPCANSNANTYPNSAELTWRQVDCHPSRLCERFFSSLCTGTVAYLYAVRVSNSWQMAKTKRRFRLRCAARRL